MILWTTWETLNFTKVANTRSWFLPTDGSWQHGCQGALFLLFPFGGSSVWSMCVPLFWSFSWQKPRGFWQTTLIFFVSVWLALIILQAYKVTVKIKSESSEADVDTSLFKSWAAEGLSSPWAMIYCPNEHPKFHTTCSAWTLYSVREKQLACLCDEALLSAAKGSQHMGRMGVSGKTVLLVYCCGLYFFTCSL